MGYLVRKADAFLREWKKNPDRKPLIIKGARQVGKTETIRTFARENYKNVIEINFITEPSYKVIVEEGFSAEHIIKLISRIDPTKHFEENETLIFFDEIQDFPEIATALKFFKENGKYDVICSGSLLGVQYQRIASISVGYKTDYQMYSMDFEEFLWAKGYSEEAISDMLCHMLEGVAFSEAEQMIFSNLFLEYCILGGMPAIVSSYIERETFEGSLDLQHQLLVDYENDIVKYAQGLDKAKILSVYRSIPAQLAKENKNVVILFIDYGQHCKDKEYQTLLQVLPEEYVDNVRVIKIGDVYKESNSRMIIEANLWEDNVVAEDMYLPYRNILFISLASAYAQSMGIKDVYTAFINSNHAKEIDCSMEFFTKLESLLYEYGSIRINMPFREMTKTEVAKLGLELNAPIEITYSCQVNSDMPCGACPNCVDRINAINNILEEKING